MKKIVALVLSLVMVLGLATVASAATPAYWTFDKAGLSVDVAVDTDNYVYSLEKFTPGYAASKTFDTVVIWKTDKVTGAKTLQSDATYIVAASAESADFAFVNGTEITWLFVNNNTTYAGAVTKLPTVDAEDAAKCGEMFVGNDKAAYTDANGKLYVEASVGAVYNVDGKLVKLDSVSVANTDLQFTTVDGLKDDPADYLPYALYIIGHDYDVDYKTFGSDKTVTRVFCTECKAEFDFVEGVEAKAIAKFGAGNYNTVQAGLYVAKVAQGAAVAPEAGETVESAKTFDAGIAMYVGMSVMAAAGSAVVLKKKD